MVKLKKRMPYNQNIKILIRNRFRVHGIGEGMSETSEKNCLIKYTEIDLGR